MGKVYGLKRHVKKVKKKKASRKWTQLPQVCTSFVVVFFNTY